MAHLIWSGKSSGQPFKCEVDTLPLSYDPRTFKRLCTWSQSQTFAVTFTSLYNCVYGASAYLFFVDCYPWRIDTGTFDLPDNRVTAFKITKETQNTALARAENTLSCVATQGNIRNLPFQVFKP